MAVSKRLRYEVLRRDDYACRYCGGRAPEAVLTVDHVTPVALGGTDAPDNLVAACRDCNSGKSATPAGAALTQQVREDAFRWAAAIKAAQAIVRKESDRRDEARNYVYDVWMDTVGDELLMPDGWEVSVDQFHDRGAQGVDFDTAAERTAAYAPRDPWSYFCGVVWRRIRETQDIAHGLLRDAD